jgi:hypothetical protein
MEGMVANSSKGHKGINPRQHGISPSWWIGLPTKAICIYQIGFPDLKYEPPSFVCMEIGTSSRAVGASPPNFGSKPNKQHVVTT